MTAAASTLFVTDSHGMEAVKVVVARSDAAEAAAVAFLSRHCSYYVGQRDYRVWSAEDVADDVSVTFSEFLWPTCEHGLSAQLCAGPGHYPTDH